MKLINITSKKPHRKETQKKPQKPQRTQNEKKGFSSEVSSKEKSENKIETYQNKSKIENGC